MADFSRPKEYRLPFSLVSNLASRQNGSQPSTVTILHRGTKYIVGFSCMQAEDRLSEWLRRYQQGDGEVPAGLGAGLLSTRLTTTVTGVTVERSVGRPRRVKV